MAEVPSPAHVTTTLDLAIRCLDLTSLGGLETPEEIEALCSKGVRPDPRDPTIPGVAAVVVYPAYVAVAAGQLEGTSVKVASVAGFPSGTEPIEEQVEEIRGAVASGADEIDIVLNRPAFLSGRRDQAAEEIMRSKEAAGSAPLKVILETGELRTKAAIREASMLAMSAGAEFLKTSTGKVGIGATVPAARTMMEAARDFHQQTERAVGIKVSGGIRQAEQALRYMVMLEEILGRDWLTPDRFRIGASSLLDDLVEKVHREHARKGSV